MRKTANGNGNGHGLHVPLVRQIEKKAAQSAAPPHAVKESRVTFKTADGVKLSGTLVRMLRHAVVFELYSPNVTPRLSEALDDFKIILQEREIYFGRAVIRNVVNAQTKVVCETTLNEMDWIDLDFALLAENTSQFGSVYKKFLKEWQKLYRVLPEFKVVVADMQTFLTDLRLWLDKLEVGIRAFSPPLSRQLEREAAHNLADPVCESIDTFIGRFESIAAKLDEDSKWPHQTYIRRKLHPLLLCSPFLNRTFTKPLGYAGDYEMVNMIIRDPLQGDSLYAKIVNFWFLQQPPAKAHRNRIEYLANNIVMTVARTTVEGRSAKFLNLGCGPAQEVQKILRECHLADYTEFTLMDFSPETLANTEAILGRIVQERELKTEIQIVNKSVNQILKEAAKQTKLRAHQQFDLVYCAGLFDYLTDPVCRELTKALYNYVSPGGMLITTNVDASNPRRLTMDYVMEWHLIYRHQSELMALKPEGISEDLCRVRSDDTGVNIYFEAQKPKDA